MTERAENWQPKNGVDVILEGRELFVQLDRKTRLNLVSIRTPKRIFLVETKNDQVYVLDTEAFPKGLDVELTDLITVEQASRESRIDDSFLRRAIRAGELPAFLELSGVTKKRRYITTQTWFDEWKATRRKVGRPRKS